MGLMLSVLVVCVGVLEALSCLEYIRYSYLPFEMKKRKRRLIIDLNTGKARHVDAVWPSDVSHDHIIKKRTGLASLPNSLEQEEQDESVVSTRKEPPFTPEELQHALSAVLFETEEEEVLGEEEEEVEDDEEEELLQEEETSEDTTDDLTQIFKPIHSTMIMQPPINDNNIKDIMGPLGISTSSNNNNLISDNLVIEKAVIERNLNQNEKLVEPKLSETLIQSNRPDSITKCETNETNKILTKEPQTDCIENQPKELSSETSKQEEFPVTQSSAALEQEIFTDSFDIFSRASTIDEDNFHDAYTRSSVATADGENVTKVENKLKLEELSENNLKQNVTAIISNAELPPKKTEEIKLETLEKEADVEKKVENCEKMRKQPLNSNCEPCARKKTVQTQYKQDFTNVVVQHTNKTKENQADVEKNKEESQKSNLNNKSIIIELCVSEGHVDTKENEADKIGDKTKAVIVSSLENNASDENFTENKSIAEQNHSKPLHISAENIVENSSKLKKESSLVESVENMAAKTESKEVIALSDTVKNDNKILAKVEIVKKETETVAVDKQEKAGDKDTKIKTNTNKNKLDTQIKKAVEIIDKNEDNEKRIIDIELVECIGGSAAVPLREQNDQEITLPDGNVDHETVRMKSSFHEIFTDTNTIKLKASEPKKDVELEKMDDPTSPDKAFWLIFSGEYTKAMSKDWHSGHFCCWQCDESLTGQRYVLRDDHPYCIKCYESVFANTCDECNKTIGIDSKDLSYKDKHWHEACFFCNKCRVSLVDKQFGSKADKIYCGNCYDAQFASRCDGCGQIFRAGTKKMEYKTRQWHEQCFCCCVCKTPIGTKSFIPREQEIYCATCYEEKFATRCVKCNKIITSGGVTYKNEPWHRECFTCTNCNTSLAGQRFTSREEKPYCADCFGELFAKRCTACCKPITGIGGTRFISFEDRHWHNDCFICAACRSSLVGRGFITDADDILCTECAKQKLM